MNHLSIVIAQNTLIRPFSELETDKDQQYIRWDNVMKYIGGNKREIVTRNVANENYNAYILKTLGDNSRYRKLEDAEGELPDYYS